MPDMLFMPTDPSSPFSHSYTRTHHQPDSSPPGLAQWACYIKASAYGSRVGWSAGLVPCPNDTHKQQGYWTTRGYPNSHTGQLADWTTCGVHNSQKPLATLRA